MFGGNSTTEPITLAAKFTNISSELISDSQNNQKLKSNIIPSEILPKFHNGTAVISNNGTAVISNNGTAVISNNGTAVISNSLPDSNFDLGLIVGIIIGVAIGISFILIIRQKNT